MGKREIIVCDNVKCIYSEDGGSFEGNIWWMCWPVHLYLHCNPDDAKEHLILKLAFETVYRENEEWTKKARIYACKRFLPYFYSVAGPGSEEVLTQEFFYHSLMPETIELGIDGRISISFCEFRIGRRPSFLDVIGTIHGGFNQLQDNGEDVPIVD